MDTASVAPVDAAADTSAVQQQPESTSHPASISQPASTDTPMADGDAAAVGPSDGAGPSSSSAAPAPQMTDAQMDEMLKGFFHDLRDVDRDNEVNRILWSFKLNPFERMNLRFDATPEDVRKQYRKLSLMVHPDKCKHPQANEAFEILGSALKDITEDETREPLMKMLDTAREEVRKERKKATKNDALHRMAVLLNEKGREGVEAEWEQTDEFHEKWKVKAREYMASVEWRKRKLSKRLKEEESRVEEDESETRERLKTVKEHNAKWETTREVRVGTWRDFQSKKGNKAVGELKPPKLKTNDEEKRYVQRPVGEQFRPPPPNVNQPKAPLGPPAAKKAK